MRALLLVPLVVIVIAAIGWAMCRAIGLTVAPRDVIAAVSICVIAGALASIPLILARRSPQGAVAQAGLMATVLHLLVAISLAAVVYLAKFPPGVGPSFLYWLLGLYWISLIVLAVCAARAVKSAPLPPDRIVGTTKQ